MVPLVAFSIEIADGQVTNVDSAKFQIDSSTGQISLASGITGLDFEAADSASGNNNYNFKVVYTDSSRGNIQGKYFSIDWE